MASTVSRGSTAVKLTLRARMAKLARASKPRESRRYFHTWWCADGAWRLLCHEAALPGRVSDVLGRRGWPRTARGARLALRASLRLRATMASLVAPAEVACKQERSRRTCNRRPRRGI